MKQRFRHDIAWGIRLGLFAAAFVSIIAIIAVFFQGVHTLERVGVSALGIFAAYLAGGFLGGLLIGALRHRITGLFSAFWCVAIAFLPTSFAITVTLRGWITQWDDLDWGGAVFVALLLSLLTVITLREDFPQKWI